MRLIWLQYSQSKSRIGKGHFWRKNAPFNQSRSPLNMHSKLRRCNRFSSKSRKECFVYPDLPRLCLGTTFDNFILCNLRRYLFFMFEKQTLAPRMLPSWLLRALRAPRLFSGTARTSLTVAQSRSDRLSPIADWASVCISNRGGKTSRQPNEAGKATREKVDAKWSARGGRCVGSRETVKGRTSTEEVDEGWGRCF